MTITREELLRRIKSCVLEIEPDAEIILYGSRARGDAHEESDWDLLVLVQHEVSRAEMTALQRKIHRDVEYDAEVALSPIVRYKDEWSRMKILPFYQNVMSEGIML
jgi:uncharacterized protein